MSIYGTLTEANTYHSDRGNSTWAAATEAARNEALLRASDYIDGRYRVRLTTGRWRSAFVGERTDGRSQAREWPRTNAVDYEGNEIPTDEVPTEIENATYEAALRELATPGSLSPDYTPSAQAMKEKVGPIEVQYRDNAPTQDNKTPNRPIVPAIDEIVAPLLRAVSDYPVALVV